jgi:hypothetical protein
MLNGLGRPGLRPRGGMPPPEPASVCSWGRLSRLVPRPRPTLGGNPWRPLLLLYPATILLLIPWSRARAIRYSAIAPAAAPAAVAAPAAASSGQQTVTRPAGCAQLADYRFIDVLGRQLTEAQGQYRLTAGAVAGGETLTVTVSSLARPVPSSFFAAAGADLASCPRYVTIQPAGTLVWTAGGFTVPEIGARTWGVDFSTSLRDSEGFAGESVAWAMAIIGRDFIIVSQTTITLGIEPPPDRALTAAVLTAAVAAFRQSALGVGQACREFRVSTLKLAHELVGDGNGFTSAQRADFRAYGATVTALGELLGRGGSHDGLVLDLEQTGAASTVVGTSSDQNKEQAVALSAEATLYPLIRKPCIAIGSWPK